MSRLTPAADTIAGINNVDISPICTVFSILLVFICFIICFSFTLYITVWGNKVLHSSLIICSNLDLESLENPEQKE
jgi:hypothetical protein